MEAFRIMEQRFMALREKLEYGVYHVAAPLQIHAHISSQPIPFARRESVPGRQLLPGEHWGDVFDCGWFHFTGTIPEQVRDAHLAVLVDVSAEGLVVDKNGDPIQGLTSATSRNEFPLGLWGKRTIEMKDCSADGKHVDFWADFTCCDVEGQYRNHGRVKEACIAVIDDLCRDAFYDWVVCQSLFVGLCENGDPYGDEVGAIISQAADILERSLGEKLVVSDAAGDTEALMMGRHEYGRDELGLDASQERISIWPDPETEHTKKFQLTISEDALRQVRQILSTILERPNTESPMCYSSMGHSHLDLLFLWPVGETPRKCARTMSNVLKMMDRFPDFKFCLSQAPVYIWLKEQYPALYQRILKKIEEKRIEAVGAFWIECDTNLPSGESLVRQLLYGKRFFRKEFGLDMKVGFLPDVFGYSAALPQLFVKSDVPYFTTNKLSMNDTNRFPRYTFWWYGLDGTKILTHMLPENSYTSAAVPQMAIYGQHHYTDMDLCDRGLQLFGLGDGGGGPGYEHMERRQRSRNLKGCPPFEDEFVVDFFDRIAKNSDSYRSWHGELYFERHQGTYTSIANQKKWNRTLEQDLHALEWLASLAHDQLGEAYPTDWLQQCWQDVMLYQFHDHLPGSAISEVYKETHARYDQLHREAQGMIQAYLQKLADALPAKPYAQPLAVANPTSFPRTDVIRRDGKELQVTTAPFQLRLVDWAKATPARDIPAEMDYTLENDQICLHFTPSGTVDRLYDKISRRELLPQGQEGNRLRLYPDELTHWDIEKAYLDAPAEDAVLTTIQKFHRGSAQIMELSFRIGKASTLRQQVILESSSARADFRTEVDWQEEYQMLRVQWPVDVVADHAACDIQFGHVDRPTHQNTTWDQAKFEVCAHKWVDLSDRSGGLALLNDCKYGYKIWDNVLDLCLLRSQNCPAEQGDLGQHSFTYAIYPHKGDIWDGGVKREGYQLNHPLLCTAKKTVSSTPLEGTFLELDDSTIVLETVKKREDSEDLILRFYEAAGGSAQARIRLHGYQAVSLCNLLEEPMESADLTVTEDGAAIRFHPFEVQTLLITPCH